MVKLEQALIIDPPAELHFQAPFNDVTSYIQLHNPTDRQICFKLKTTAPKTYYVRPNSGTIFPRNTVTVAVMLQTLDVEATDKNKHKFMVQSVFAPDGDVNQDALWSETPPDCFMNSKLKCVFDVASPEPQVSTDDVPKDDSGNLQEERTDVSHGFVTVSSKAVVKEDLKKLEDEHKQLIALVAELKQENALLKEESLRYRRSHAPDDEPSTFPTDKLSLPLQAQHSKLNQSSKHMYLIYIFALIVGIFIGHNFF